MALYITIDGQEILYRGKNQIPDSIEINSWPLIDDQPAHKSLCYYTSTGVELKTTSMLVEEYANEKIEEMRNLIYTRWIDSSKAVTALKAQYDVFKTNALSATSTSEVDDEYETLETWLDLS